MPIAMASDDAEYALKEEIKAWLVAQDHGVTHFGAPFCAGLAGSRSDTTVLCIGGKIIGSALAMEVVRTWMGTDFFGEQDKYVRRVEKVREISERHLRPLDAG